MLCINSDIQLCLVENANNLIVKTIGFKLNNLQYCGHYRAFLKYIASLNGVSEVRFNENGVRNRGFKGIKLKEDPMEMYNNNEQSNEDDLSEMDL